MALGIGTGEFAQVNLGGPGTFSGPRRFIEWVKPMDLYYQYQAFTEARGEQAASFNTFRRIMKPVFKSHLKCRDKGEHGQCDTCFRLRMKIRKALSKEARASVVQSYTRHLLSQWLDRSVYWQLRGQARTFFADSLYLADKMYKASIQTSVLTLIQDGMDQSKLRLPRRGYVQASKAWQKMFRPACHLVGTWMHGWRLQFSLSDEDMPKNSVTSIELIARALSDLVAEVGHLPVQVHLQQDNCYREGKNRYMMTFFLLLVTLGICRFSALGFLRSGHSHEDIDQAFGQVARVLIGKSIACPAELIQILTEVTGSGKRIRGSEATAEKLDETCCWKDFVRQAGVVFKGLRHVHYFRFCARKDLGTDVLDNVLELEELRGHWERHPEDIFLVTKRWLADTEVQRALAIIPAELASQMRAGFHPPAGIAPRKTIHEQIRKNLEKTVPPCFKSGELSRDGAEYLQHWSQGTLQRNRRPANYAILAYRHSESLRRECHRPGTWTIPRRPRHFDLTLEQTDCVQDSDDSGSENGAIDLCEGLEA